MIPMGMLIIMKFNSLSGSRSCLGARKYARVHAARMPKQTHTAYHMISMLNRVNATGFGCGMDDSFPIIASQLLSLHCSQRTYIEFYNGRGSGSRGPLEMEAGRYVEEIALKVWSGGVKWLTVEYKWIKME